MNVSQFLKVLGRKESTKFKVSYYSETGEEILVETDFFEAVNDLFGEYMLDGDECVFFETTKDKTPIIRLYVGTLKKQEGNARNRNGRLRWAKQEKRQLKNGWRIAISGTAYATGTGMKHASLANYAHPSTPTKHILSDRSRGT